MAEIITTDKKVKVISFYLPQYYAIPENDKNWGKGFTEWTNVRKALPLFEGHNQPRIPLDDNYYTLLDEKTQIWQSKLAKKYDVFGYCYYHYWMKNGKLLLEKPAEIMLKNKKRDLPFCFSWANENWTRNWGGGNREVIVEQDYGDESDWKKHLEYLIPFMKDKRYITINGNPVFLIYKPMEIPRLDEMLQCWNDEIRHYGFHKVSFIVQGGCDIPMKYKKLFDYQVKFQPNFTVSKIFSTKHRIAGLLERLKMAYLLDIYRRFSQKNIQKGSSQKRLDYDESWNRILKSKSDKFYIEGAFTDWDNTARNKNGLMYLNAAPEKFEHYMKRLVEKISRSNQLPVIFVNAWNEWGEGAYLEPDAKNGYKYLAAVKEAVNTGGGNVDNK